MKYKSIYKTVTALMLTVASVQSVLAGPGWVTQQNDDRVEAQYSAAPLTLSKKPIITKEDKWWREFKASKSDNIAQYVHDLSKRNPEAAAWFLLTGGKDGFANRQATAEEEKLLLGAMKIISSNLDKSQKIIEYCVSEIGKFHLDLMYKQFDQIAPIVQKLNLQSIEDKYFSNHKNSILSSMEGLIWDQIEEAFNDANRLSEYSLFSDKLKKGLVAICSAVQDKYFIDVKPIEDKYFIDVKPIEDKYYSDHKLVEDKYYSDHKLVEDKYYSDHKLVEDKYDIDVGRRIKSGNLDTLDLFRKKEATTLDLFRKKEATTLDLFRKKEATTLDLFRKKEATTLDLFRKKEATTLDLFRKKEAVKEKMSKASYFDLVDLVNHYYPNSI